MLVVPVVPVAGEAHSPAGNSPQPPSAFLLPNDRCGVEPSPGARRRARAAVRARRRAGRAQPASGARRRALTGPRPEGLVEGPQLCCLLTRPAMIWRLRAVAGRRPSLRATSTN